MLKASHRLLIVALASICLACGCGTGNPSAKTFPLVVFTDLHFNPYDDPTLFPALAAADPSQWESIFKTSSQTTPSAWGKDANYPLLALALKSIKQNAGATPFFMYSGDLLGHYFPQQFWGLCNCNNDPVAMKAFTDKTVTFLMSEIRSAAGNTPVLFAVGNADSYTGYGPDNSFLADTAELYYTKFLNGAAADHQAFLTTFLAGGYYSAEPAGMDVMVLGLNTSVFSPLVPANMLTPDNATVVTGELIWLDAKLAQAQSEGKKVWLVMHVPPGADLATTSGSVDANGHIPSATMMWNADYQTSFLTTLAKYPGVVSMTLAAHTHMDEFRIMQANDVLTITPSIAPYFGNNPAYKILRVSNDSLTPTDYTSLNYDLATMPQQFNRYYTFSSSYFMQGDLDTSLTELLPSLATSPGKQALYRGHYYSGHNNPPPALHSNIITDANWPLFECGISNMTEQELVDCVNAH